MQVELGQRAAHVLFNQECAAFFAQSRHFPKLFFCQADTRVITFVFGSRVGQQNFGYGLLYNCIEDRRIDGIFWRLRRQNQQAAQFTVGFQAVENKAGSRRIRRRQPKLLYHGKQRASGFCHSIQHDVFHVEKAGKQRLGWPVVGFQDVGQVKADAEKLVGIEQV